MEKQNVRKAVGAIVFKGDKFLLVHRAPRIVLDDGKIFPAKVGEWNFPRGGIRAGEKEEDALKRELSEEIGGTTDFEIVRKLPFKLFFAFPPEVTAANGYTHQENSLFLVRFTGSEKSIKPDENENDAVGFFTLSEALEKIKQKESNESFRAAVELLAP